MGEAKITTHNEPGCNIFTDHELIWLETIRSKISWLEAINTKELMVGLSIENLGRKCEDRNIMLLGRYEDQEVFLLQNCEANVYRGQFAANMRSGITAYPKMLKFLEVPNFEIICTTIFQQMIWVISNISKVFLNGIRATRVQTWSICLEDPEMSQQMLEYVPKL